MKAVLVGNGSVGKRHLANLRKVAECVFVIDTNKDNLVGLTDKERAFNSLSDFSDEFEFVSSDNYSRDIAIIANWGPDHFNTATNLISRGFQKLLIEKPLASSLLDVSRYENLISDDTQIWCNFHLRFGEGLALLQAFQKQYSLDTPVSISVTGGAKCLSTTGIHWIDFALILYREIPKEVYGHVANSNLNPRSSSLSFLDGLCFFKFSGGRTLTINFSNYSRCDSSVVILWENYKAEIIDGDVKIYGSNSPGTDSLPVTRTRPLNELITKSKLSAVGFETLFSEFMNSESTQVNLLTANRALILALVSSELGRKLDWDEEVPLSLVSQNWRIS